MDLDRISIGYNLIHHQISLAFRHKIGYHITVGKIKIDKMEETMINAIRCNRCGAVISTGGCKVFEECRCEATVVDHDLFYVNRAYDYPNGLGYTAKELEEATGWVMHPDTGIFELIDC